MTQPPVLKPGLVKKLEEYRAHRKFDPEAWVKQKCTVFNEYMSKSGLKGCVVSISGGVDSAVTLALCHYAGSKLADSPIKKIVGVCQPIHSSGWALQRGQEVIRKFQASSGSLIQEVVIDQSALFDQLSGLIDKGTGIEGKSFAKGNLKSYMRTPAGYGVAQWVSQAGFPAVVMGTGNFDEDGYLCYFCVAGDGVVDIQLISDLHKSEVFKVGRFLGVPASILDAAPSADLWDGQTDEGELGLTYDFIELFAGWVLNTPQAEVDAWLATLDAESRKQYDDWKEKAETVHRRNAHKLTKPLNLYLCKPGAAQAAAAAAASGGEHHHHHHHHST